MFGKSVVMVVEKQTCIYYFSCSQMNKIQNKTRKTKIAYACFRYFEVLIVLSKMVYSK